MTVMSDRIEVADVFEAIEYMLEHNMTDGLACRFPPTPERVEEFLAYVGIDGDTVIGEVREPRQSDHRREACDQCRDGRLQARIHAGAHGCGRGGV